MYVLPARNVPVMVIELLIVEPGVIDPMNDFMGKVVVVPLNEVMLMLEMATVPEFCTVTVSVAPVELGIRE